MIRRTLVLAILGLLGTATAAHAANNTIANALQGVLGERRSQTLAPDAAGYYGYRLYANRSYLVFCWEPTLEGQGPSSGFCLVDIRDGADLVVSANIGAAEPFPKAGKADTFTPTVSSTYYVKLLNVSFFGNPTQTATFILIETTLASPWYFVNAASGYDAFVEIRNQSISPVSVTVRAYTPTGTLAGSTTVSIPANGNTAVAVSGLGVPTGSGSLSITHNAMPGTIHANTTTLSGITGLSFDAPFTPRMVWSTF